MERAKLTNQAAIAKKAATDAFDQETSWQSLSSSLQSSLKKKPEPTADPVRADNIHKTGATHPDPRMVPGARKSSESLNPNELTFETDFVPEVKTTAAYNVHWVPISRLKHNLALLSSELRSSNGFPGHYWSTTLERYCVDLICARNRLSVQAQNLSEDEYTALTGYWQSCSETMQSLGNDNPWIRQLLRNWGIVGSTQIDSPDTGNEWLSTVGHGTQQQTGRQKELAFDSARQMHHFQRTELPRAVRAQGSEQAQVMSAEIENKTERLLLDEADLQARIGLCSRKWLNKLYFPCLLLFRGVLCDLISSKALLIPFHH